METPRKKRKLISVTVILLLVLIGIVIVKVFFGPSQGVITTAKPAAARSDQTTWIRVQTKVVNFSYPSFMVVSPTDAPKPPFLVNLSYVKTQVAGWVLAIQVETVPGGNLIEDSNYHFRSMHPETYELTTQTVNGVVVKIMRDKTANFSKTAFFSHGGSVGSISLSGGTPDDLSKIQTTFDQLLTYWSWQ